MLIIKKTRLRWWLADNITTPSTKNTQTNKPENKIKLNEETKYHAHIEIQHAQCLWKICIIKLSFMSTFPIVFELNVLPSSHSHICHQAVCKSIGNYWKGVHKLFRAFDSLLTVVFAGGTKWLHRKWVSGNQGPALLRNAHRIQHAFYLVTQAPGSISPMINMYIDV